MSNASQNFIPINEVRDGVVLLSGGGLRAIIMVSSMNYDLKSEDEQRGLIEQFQRLLNSLDFPIQFFVQSRKLDIRPYLMKLEKRQKEVQEELLQVQIREYIEFIRWFSEQTNIMRKNFFVVVPYDAPVIKSQTGFLNKILNRGKEKTENQQFDELRTQLEQRISIVQDGLASIGLRGQQLGTQELIEVYYQIFNPGELTTKPGQMERTTAKQQ